MIPVWAIEYLARKPLGAIPDFLKGFWNGLTGKKSEVISPGGPQSIVIKRKAEVKTEEDNTLLYIGIIIGVVIFLIIIITMMSEK